MVRIRIILSVWLVSCYPLVLLLLSIVVVTLWPLNGVINPVPHVVDIVGEGDNAK